MADFPKTDQVLIKSKYANSRVIDRGTVLDNEGLRVYRESPTTIHIQIRTTSAAQGRVSGLSITAAQAREVAAYLLRKADELRDDEAA